MSTYDDASLILIPSGVKAGKVYSAKPVPSYGAELVTNGDFATDTDWSKGSTWAISGGTANCTGNSTNQDLTQSNLTIGKLYYISVDITSSTLSSQAFRVYAGGVYTDFTLSGSAQTITTNLVASSAVLDLRVTSANSSGSVSIDNVSVKEVLIDDGDFTFTRASEATRLVDGVVTKVRTNSILQSNDFDTTPFTGTRIILTGGQADKDGGTNAWKLVANTSNSTHYIAQSVTISNGIACLSIYAKAGGYNYFTIRDDSSGNSYAKFDLATVATATGGTNAITSSIDSVGDGWYRCSMTFTETVAGNILFYVNNAYDFAGIYAGDGTSGIYIQNAQLEYGTVATDYIATTTVAVSEGPVANMPRLNSVAGGCPSLILEPSRTNLWPSEYITSWLSNGATVDYNATTSPDSYLNAMRLNSTTSQSRIQLNNGTITGGYTGSVYVKSAGDYATLRLRLNTTGEQLQFNINTDGTVTRLTGDADYTITDAGNGWHRVTALFTAVGDSNNYFQIYADSSGGGSSVYIYGIQFELGNYPTSLHSHLRYSCYKG